jgi:transposase-like protein
MDELDGELPQCPHCKLYRLEPAGELARPYWWCPQCGAVRIIG